MEQIRRTYGVHCTLLSVNSFDPDAPAPLEGDKDRRPAIFDDLWEPFLRQRRRGSAGPTMDQKSQALSVFQTIRPGTGMGNKDVLAIRIFLREFVVQSLVPYMERNVQQWNEQVRLLRFFLRAGG